MLESWSGHQFQTFDHKLMADAANLPLDKVILHTLISGGSFGRRANFISDFCVAAVNIAAAIKGRAPVRLQYTREDDTSFGLYRPMYVHAVKAGLDASGSLARWQHTIVGQSILCRHRHGVDGRQKRCRYVLGLRRVSDALRHSGDDLRLAFAEAASPAAAFALCGQHAYRLRHGDHAG
jgi:CO/xanthine dehydrogenase Mo-binding subunit